MNTAMDDGPETVLRSQVASAEAKLERVRQLLRKFRTKNGNLLSCREGKEWDKLVKELGL